MRDIFGADVPRVSPTYHFDPVPYAEKSDAISPRVNLSRSGIKRLVF